MYDIPTTVEINGKQFQIRNNGDYRMVLDCFLALQDVELSQQERLFASLIIFYQDLNAIEDVAIFDDVETAVLEMYKFFNCGNESMGKKTNHKLVDWEQDAQLISSAVNKVAGKEVRLEPYVHWWTFVGYYTAIGECPLSTIISIRDKIVRGKQLEKYERQFRTDNPQYFTWNSKTVEENEAELLAKQIWNSGD